MNINNIRKKLASSEREYLIWKYAVDFYDKFSDEPLPDNLIDAIFVAYLISENIAEAKTLLNNKGYRTDRGTKLTTNDISDVIQTSESFDENLTYCVRGIFKHAKAYINAKYN